MSAPGTNKSLAKKQTKSRKKSTESVGAVALSQVKQRSQNRTGDGTVQSKKKAKQTSNGSLPHEGKKTSSDNPKRRKAPTRPIKETSKDVKASEPSDNSLRRSVSPRKEQYSHLLDEVVGCGDMVLLEPLTEENIIENLRKRYEAGDIYVS